MSDISVRVEVFDGDQFSHIEEVIVGLVLVHTGIKPGHFSINLNQRNNGTNYSNFDRLAIGNIPSVYLLRKVIIYP